SVSVQAFSDPNYNTAIPVPGSFGASTTYSYGINLGAMGVIYVDAGAGNDRIVVSADLGPVEIRVRGMAGTDQLIINGGAGVDDIVVNGDVVDARLGAGRGFFTVYYSELERLTVNASGDTVSVYSTSVSTVLSSSSRRGTVNVGSNTNMRGPLTINNAATVSIGPSDERSARASVAINSPNFQTTLIMDDRNNRQANDFSVTGSSIFCDGYSVIYSASQI